MLLLARVVGIGVETADMLVQEVLSRNVRDRRAVARYAGLTGSPDESGAKRREKGLARSGNARVRRGMIQLAWRFLWLQKDSALAEWYWQRTQTAPATRKTLIVALARKLLIALLSFPKILSVRIRALRQNQGIIRFDTQTPPADWHFRRQPVQVAAPA